MLRYAYALKFLTEAGHRVEVVAAWSFQQPERVGDKNSVYNECERHLLLFGCSKVAECIRSIPRVLRRLVAGVDALTCPGLMSNDSREPTWSALSSSKSYPTRL